MRLGFIGFRGEVRGALGLYGFVLPQGLRALGLGALGCLSYRFQGLGPGFYLGFVAGLGDDKLGPVDLRAVDVGAKDHDADASA